MSERPLRGLDLTLRVSRKVLMCGDERAGPLNSVRGGVNQARAVVHSNRSSSVL